MFKVSVATAWRCSSTIASCTTSPPTPPAVVAVRRAYQRIKQMLTEIVREGRESGEFERKTPLDETVRAIDLVMQPYVNPLLLQYNLDVAEEAPAQLSNLVLRLGSLDRSSDIDNNSH